MSDIEMTGANSIGEFWGNIIKVMREDGAFHVDTEYKVDGVRCEFRIQLLRAERLDD